MITNKKHNKIVEELKEKNNQLTQELKEARDLKDILKKMSSMTINGIGYSVTDGNWNIALNLPDTVLQYTDDILGGKVIKQEGNKCLVIDKEGNVKTGLTKQKVDKGYSYKLIRK